VSRASVAALALLIAPVVAAQTPAARPLTFETRIDGIFGRRVTTTHVGLGVTRRASRSFDIQAVVGGGFTIRDETNDATASARADVLARFAPQPVSRNRWSAYAAGGVSALVERHARGRAVLALLVGASWRRAFVEAGLGGGVRVGAGLRF
jgi:hypothetical protein